MRDRDRSRCRRGAAHGLSYPPGGRGHGFPPAHRLGIYEGEPSRIKHLPPIRPAQGRYGTVAQRSLGQGEIECRLPGRGRDPVGKCSGAVSASGRSAGGQAAPRRGATKKLLIIIGRILFVFSYLESLARVASALRRPKRRIAPHYGHRFSHRRVEEVGRIPPLCDVHGLLHTRRTATVDICHSSFLR